MIRLFKNSLYIFLSFLLTFLSGAIYAQDWVLSVENIQPENCVSNGGFTIKITGSDAGSLTSVQYGVTSAEYNVTPNNSPIFIGAPKGTYTVLVEAFYMGGYVSKTINVTVPGDYVYPGFSSAVVRNSLSCESAAKGYGQLGVSGIVGSSKPYTFELTETPPGYTGQTIFTVSSTSGILEELISGTYKIQMTDACGSKTAVHSITIKKLYLGDIIPLLSNGQIKYPHANFTGTNNCNYYRVEPPHINTNAYPDWSGYLSESSPIKWAVSFVGHEADKSEYKSWVSWSYNHVKLPGGKTYKDYYGSSNIDYLKLFLQLPCGTDTSFVLTKDSPNLMYYYYAYGPYIDWKITSVCDKGILIGATLGESTAIICYPMEVEVYNYNSSTPTYYKKTTVTEAGSIAFTDTIPYGKYTLRAVSADGAIFGGDYEKNSPSKFGYKLGRNGYSLHNKVEFIQITRGSNELLPVGTKYALLDTLDGVGYGYQAVLTTATSYLNVQGSDDPSSVN